VAAEERNLHHELPGLLLHRLRGRGGFLDQRRILLSRVVHLGDGIVHLLDAGRLLVAGMTTQIASSAPDASSTVQSMLIELPVRHEERASVVRLLVERDRSRRQLVGTDSWTVEAAMDLGAVGALHAKVSLTGRRIGVQLRAESPSVVEALSMRAGELESLLRESGLEIERVVCLHGMPAGDTGVRPARLLDVRA
jgi:Flagellar hook-length control protein FliK